MNLGDMEYLICEKHNTRSWKKGDYCDECKVEQLEAENARLREEFAAAQLDAARYRWLRENLDNTEALEELYEYPGDIPTAEEFDAAIDNAMQEEGE